MLIFEGKLRPGIRLHRAAIALDLRVSVTPLREALIVLEREGWISSEMFRGTFINTLDRATIHDHYELLGMVNGYTAQRAFARTKGNVLTPLIELLGRFTNTEELDELQQISADFHSTIARAAASPLLNAVLLAMTSFVPTNLFDAVPGALEVEARGLEAVVGAMQRKDLKRISEEYVEMMRGTGDQVVQLLAGRAFFEEN